MVIQKKRITANEEILEQENATVDVQPEATDLLFEAEDVAELVAEVTGEPVEVSVEDESVTFAVGEEEFIVEAEGDEELVESASRRQLRGKRAVAASTNRSRGRRSGKTVKKFPTRK